MEAAQCGVEIQQAMAARNTGLPEERKMLLRIGINVGDVMVKDKDIFGDGVNVAARLQGLAVPGGICISRAVRDQLRDKSPFVFEDQGEQAVKNIARPVRVFAVRFEGAPKGRLRIGIDPLGVEIASTTTADDATGGRRTRPNWRSGIDHGQHSGLRPSPISSAIRPAISAPWRGRG
jgi:hypothetical protein